MFLLTAVRVPMSLPPDLQKLPPQALDVIRYLSTQEGSVHIDAILDKTGLSERSFGKAIRRLVTGYYVDMPEPGCYALSVRKGLPAAEQLRAYDGDLPPEEAAEPVPASADPVTAAPMAARPIIDAPVTASPIAETPVVASPIMDAPITASPITEVPAAASPVMGAPVAGGLVRHNRRLSVVAVGELVARTPTALMAGFDAPIGAPILSSQPARVILRVSAPGCDVSPTERPLEVASDKPAGPVRFEVIPHQTGRVQIKVEILQIITLEDIRILGGMYFNRGVSELPTPRNAELQTLTTTAGLYMLVTP